MRKQPEQPGSERWRAFFRAIKRMADALDALERDTCGAEDRAEGAGRA